MIIVHHYNLILKSIFKSKLLLFLLSTNFLLNAQEQNEQYKEAFTESYPIRKEQHLEIQSYLQNLLSNKIEYSLNKFEPDLSNIENYENSLTPFRIQLGEYFGYPPPKSTRGKISRFEKVGEDKYSNIYRVWIEVIEQVHTYGLYLLPKNHAEKLPLIVAIHGGGGNPEAICGLDTRINYHNFGFEAVKRGYAVWAPGLTMLSGYSKDPKIPGVSREILDEQLSLIGSSIIGLELHKIIESTLTLIQARPEIDANKIGMTGLSWGGFYTMYSAALAPFVKVAVPSGYLRDSRKDLESMLEVDSKSSIYSFKGFGHFQVIGMICPRPCMVQMGKNDKLFDLEGAKKEVDRALSFYKNLGIPEKFVFDVHPGGHEYENDAIFKFFEEYL